MTDAIVMTGLPSTTVEAEAYVAKMKQAYESLPPLAEIPDLVVSAATNAYGSSPPVGEVYDATFSTLREKAPDAVVSLVDHFTTETIPKGYVFSDVDKTAILVILACTMMASVYGVYRLTAYVIRCLCQRCASVREVSENPTARSAQSANVDAEMEPEAEEETVKATKSRGTATKTPRLKTPSRTGATVVAEPCTVESATPAPAKVLDFGVTPKRGATPKSVSVLEESVSKKVNKAVAEETETPRRSARLAEKTGAQPMPAVEESEPMTLPVETPSFEWEKLTVPDLKAELKRRGEKVGQQRKADLVARLEELDKENRIAQ
jgi:hypothetical protein